MFARSTNCGLSLADPATKLSEGFPLGSGTAIAVNPINPNDIYVVWRQIRNSKQADAILFARSTDGGRSFTKATPVPGLGEGQYAPFDQNTTSPAIGSATQTFRTVGFAAVTFGDDGFLYLAVSQVPGGPSGTLGGAQSRITLTRTNNGTTWETPVAVVDTGAAGQQFMPALAYAAGKLQLIWYDVRFDESEQTQTTSDRRGAGDRRRPSPSHHRCAWRPSFAALGSGRQCFSATACRNPTTTIRSPNGPPLLRGPRISQYLDRRSRPAESRRRRSAAQVQPRQPAAVWRRAASPSWATTSTSHPSSSCPMAPASGCSTASGTRSNTALGTFQTAWTDNRDARVGNATTPPHPLPTAS